MDSWVTFTHIIQDCFIGTGALKDVDKISFYQTAI